MSITINLVISFLSTPAFFKLFNNSPPLNSAIAKEKSPSHIPKSIKIFSFLYSIKNPPKLIKYLPS